MGKSRVRINPKSRASSNTEKSESEPKMSSKRKKRFEKFLEKQLKKESRIQLLEKLSTTKFQDSNLLISSKALGKKLSVREKLRYS